MPAAERVREAADGDAFGAEVWDGKPAGAPRAMVAADRTFLPVGPNTGWGTNSNHLMMIRVQNGSEPCG